MAHKITLIPGDGIGPEVTGATIRLANSTVTGNTTDGFATSAGGVVASYGDNYIDGNAGNSGPLTLISRQ